MPILRSNCTLCRQKKAGPTFFCNNGAKFGIGTNSPNYILDVVGDINTSTLYRAGATAGVTQAAITPGSITIKGGIVTAISAGAAGNSGIAVAQTGHGFTAGQAVYFNGSAWALAQSNAAGTLGLALVVVVDVNNFIAVTQGLITGLSGLTAGQYYFVSDATPGALTTTEPTSTSSYSNPLLFALSTTTGIVLPFRPNSIVKQQTRVVTKTGNYTAVAGDIIFCNTASGGFTVTLPLSSTNPSAEIIVKKISADGNAVTIATSGSDKVDLSTTNYILDQSGDAMDVIADGTTNWGIV